MTFIQFTTMSIPTVQQGQKSELVGFASIYTVDKRGEVRAIVRIQFV